MAVKRKQITRKTPKAGPYIATARAKKMPGKTVRIGGTQVIGPQRKGQKPLAFKKGGLRQQLGVKPGEKIPASKMQAAAAGRYGKLAQKRARFAQNVLAKGRRTASR